MTFPYNFIAIEGCIGAGKTQLSKKIAERLNARLILEQFEDNPFLPKFYKDKRRYSFPLEISFLAARYQQLSAELQPRSLFQNYTVSDYIIGKCLLFSRINLDADEFSLYHKIFEIIQANVPSPDLFIYLHNTYENLLRNIQLRGRPYEQDIDLEYLSNINEGYLQLIKNLPGLRILILDTSKIDFVNNESHFDAIYQLIHQQYEPGIHRISL